jgi:hypothetical protein
MGTRSPPTIFGDGTAAAPVDDNDDDDEMEPATLEPDKSTKTSKNRTNQQRGRQEAAAGKPRQVNWSVVMVMGKG